MAAKHTLYDAYFPLIFKALSTADYILDKAQAHAKENGLDPDVDYINAKLYEDMYPLGKQIQTLSRVVQRSIFHLTGLGPGDWGEEGKTFAELHARIQKTRDLVKQVKPEQINDREDEELELFKPGTQDKATVGDWVSTYLTANLFFHTVTAYNILRMKGVPLGKLDYLSQFLNE
ncbi:hypothetical protein M406DRAFT_357062 [Cryphonectria parasitica EP155]|uniref:DUF1993 domain-containing protein n=1 Tax=Cryphonectria parasitica (strain ATCC 38755 / EP155) TaxID=660469 RepID=A0A9P4XXX9_CRYP1|nr:uncharacterized protein M406DRAFT_357062 [Cryphonectria parasitica EP155]KAF3763387.1 hypothetical protein M406DRAFT_357062 [Cryphonectria parasitica EP155]